MPVAPNNEGFGISKHPNASSGVPSLYFIGDEGTGIGSESANELDFYSNYSKMFSFTGSTMTIASSKTLALSTDKLTINSTIVRANWDASFFLPGATAATAGNYGVVFYTASRACQVTAVVERHATAGSDGGAVTVMLKKVPSGTAAASGTDTLTAGISLKGTADTNAAGTLHGTTGNLQLAAGDSLAVVLTGTPTAVAGMGLNVQLKAI